MPESVVQSAPEAASARTTGIFRTAAELMVDKETWWRCPWIEGYRNVAIEP